MVLFVDIFVVFSLLQFFQAMLWGLVDDHDDVIGSDDILRDDILKKIENRIDKWKL